MTEVLTIKKCCGKNPLTKSEKIRPVPDQIGETGMLIFLFCEVCDRQSPRLKLPYKSGELYPHLEQLWNWRMIADERE